MARKKIPATQQQLRSALRREQLATGRYEKWSREWQRLMDSADRRKSKSWRSRDLKAAQQAARQAERAERDVFLWRDRVRKYEALDRRRQKKTDSQRKRRQRKKTGAASWEYVLKVNYKGRGRRTAKAVWWDVRLRKDDGTRATKAEVGKAVRQIRNGELPDNWTIEGIAWDRGARPSWGEEPAREPSSSEQAEAALTSLANTLGDVEGQDYKVIGLEVGEEEMLDDLDE